MVEALFYAFFVGTGLGFLYDLMRFFRLSFGGSLFFDLLFYYKYDILIKKLNGESYEHTDIWNKEMQ